MDEKVGEELRSRIEARPKTAAGRRIYTVALKREVIAFVEQARAEGRSQKQAADALGLNKATVCGWIREAKPKSKTKASSTKASPVKAVHVQAVPTKVGLTLQIAGGHRVEGLRVEQLAQLMKALA